MSEMNESSAHTLEELLADWELSRLEGKELPPEDLAKDHPELLDDVRAGIKALRSTAWVMEDLKESPIPSARSDFSEPLPESSVSVDELVAALRASDIVSLESIEAVAGGNNNDRSEATARDLASALVQQGDLTAYQARTLLSSGIDPLLLDRYLILDVIGEGGMGVVFKALHRSMERIVALKILPSLSIDSPTKVERFRREIKAVAQLSHPNIASAYDAHETDGTHFLAMEYVPGKNLFDHISENGPLPVSESLAIASQIANALGEAHRLGIIHRDVKPSNILLSTEGIPKLLDLGIAQVRQPSDEAGELTTDGIPVGTVAYTAPEQIRGDGDVDARADIYSLGCTLFFLLTGKPLFERKSGVQIVAAHLTEEPPRLGECGTDFPAALERVFVRMVAKNPSHRFGSMADVESALEATGLVDAHMMPNTGRKSLTDARQFFSTGHPWRIAGISLALAGILTAAAVLLYQFALSDKRVAKIESRPGVGTQGGGMPTATNSEDAQREVARWILGQGGGIVVQNQAGEWTCENESDLPAGPFDVVAVEFRQPFANFDLVALSSFPKLEALTFWEVDLPSSTLETLTKLRSVVDLGLSGCRLSDQDLAPVSKMTWLRKVDLSGNQITDLTIENLVELEQLESLDLRQTEITDSGLEHIAGLPQLTALGISGSRISPAGFRKFVKLPRIRSLALEGIEISSSEIDVLRELPELSVLWISHLSTTNALVDELASLPNLEELRLDESNLDDAQLVKLSKAPKLRTLIAEESRLTVAGVEQFKTLRPEVEVLWRSDVDDD
ncbi:MAG: protein kinase [Pseudomonadota bacterium]